MTALDGKLAELNVGQATEAVIYEGELAASADGTAVLDASRAARVEVEIRCTGLNANDGTVQFFWGNTKSDVYESYGTATTLSSASFKDHVELPTVKGRWLKAVYTKNTVSAGTVTLKFFGRS